MRTEVRTECVEQKVTFFIADDGKEFRDQQECARYDEEIKSGEIIRGVLSMPHVIRSAESVEVMCGREYDMLLIFRPRSEEDIASINKLFEMTGDTHWAIKPDDAQKYIDGGVCLYGYDDWWGYGDDDITSSLELYYFMGTIEEFKSCYAKSIDAICNEIK